MKHVPDEVKQKCKKMVRELEKTIMFKFRQFQRETKKKVKTRSTQVSPDKLASEMFNGERFKFLLKRIAVKRLKMGKKGKFEIKEVLDFLRSKNYL